MDRWCDNHTELIVLIGIGVCGWYVTVWTKGCDGWSVRDGVMV